MTPGRIVSKLFMYDSFIYLKPKFMWYIVQSSQKIQYSSLAKTASGGTACRSHGKAYTSLHRCTSAFPYMAKSAPNMLHISVQSKEKKAVWFLNIP